MGKPKAPKAKTAQKKKAIQPVEFTRADLEVRPVVKPGMPVPVLRPLAEFSKFGQPLNLQKSEARSRAPKFEGYRCVAAWTVVHDSEELEQFKARSEELGNVHTLYHGSPARNITAIAEYGLRLGRAHSMFGSGIYLGPPEKAFGYTGGSWRDAQQARYILEVRAILGKVLELDCSVHHTLRSVRAAGCDSVGARAGWTQGRYGALRNSENVLYSPEQALVVAVFEYQQVSHVEYRARMVHGACELMRHDLKKLAELKTDKKYAGFDVTAMAETVCGAQAVVRITTEWGTHWVCNQCITRLSLKVGSKIRLHRVRWKQAPVVEGRISDVIPPRTW